MKGRGFETPGSSRPTGVQRQGEAPRRWLWVLAVGVGVATLPACGRGKTQGPEAPRVAVVDTAALQKLVQGVQAAKDSKSRAKAARLFKEAVEADPNLWEARYNLGVILAEDGEFEKAESELSKAYELAPNAEDVVMALGEVQRRLGKPESASQVLGQFVEAHPEAVDARVLLVACLRDSRQFAEAIAQAREVLVRRGSDPNALSELALTYLKQGELDTAELLSTEALKAEPKPAVAERTAGLIALGRGDDAVAFRHFEKASEIDPRDTTARLNTGTVLLRAGVYDKAEEAFRAVLSVEPEDDDAAIGLAAALRGQGRRDRPGPYDEARKLLEELIERDPDHLAATFNLAVLFGDFLQEPKRASALFAKYLKDAPKSHEGRAYAEKRLAELKAVKAASPQGN